MDVTGSGYAASLTSARSDIKSKTSVTLNYTYDGAVWWARTLDYGNTDWAGLATWTCSGGKVQGATSRLNRYHLDSASTARKKVFWLHELAHVYGLDHVSATARVMYKAPHVAFNNGVRTLTSDEVNGFNYLY